MLKIKFILISAILLCSAISSISMAAAPVPQGSSVEKGWFWFEDPALKEPPKEEEDVPLSPILSKPVAEAPPPPKEEKCKKKDTWEADCGFVDPGTDFSFQAKQRDALMERMTVSKNDPKAVEAVQYYMRWVLERTSEVTNLWWYNMTQNPDLDPTVAQPVSAFGLRLMSDVKKGSDKEIFSLLKDEGAFFVYFTRSDCEFCHSMYPNAMKLSNRVGIPIYNASLDDKCIGEFSGEFCRINSIAPAEQLKVTTVPTIFLFIPKNTWIRIATGVTDLESMINRTSQFFSAYRAALLKGVENGENGKASVDFSTSLPTGNKKGIDSPIKLPSEADINNLLGK